MTQTGHRRDSPDASAHSSAAPLSELLEDWVTIWQSELAGLVLDRELQDTALHMIDAWADQVRATLRALGPALDRPFGPGTVPPAGAAPPAAAPDARDVLIQQLVERVAELERRLGPNKG